MGEKKKRTILMGPGAEPKKEKKRPLKYRLRTRGGGVGGTLGEMKRSKKPKVEFKWKAGVVKTTPGGQRKGGSRKLKKRSKPGFKFEIKF